MPIQITYDLLKFNFSHFTDQENLFFLQKENLKFSDSKIKYDPWPKIIFNIFLIYF